VTDALNARVAQDSSFLFKLRAQDAIRLLENQKKTRESPENDPTLRQQVLEQLLANNPPESYKLEL
jgi:hypothetical protein